LTFNRRNFTKFLIARDGTIVNRFEPGVAPESAKLKKAVEAELKKK
jgi:glutathione peroxidase